MKSSSTDIVLGWVASRRVGYTVYNAYYYESESARCMYAGYGYVRYMVQIQL